MRRTIAAVMVGLAMVTAGCAPAAVQAPSTKGIGPITFAIGKDDISWLRPVIAEWNAMYPAQAVTPWYLPQAANDQLAQLVANLQAKNPVYDVIDMDVVWTAEFASNGWIIPLPGNKFRLAGFFPRAVSTAMYHGQLYAVPDYTNADLLYYRKDILAKAKVDGPPKTWAQLEYLAKTVAPRYGLQGYGGTFAQYEGLTVNFAEGVQSAGGSILNAAGTQVTLNTPQALAGLEFLVDGFRHGWIPRAALKYEEVAAQDEFVSGKFLFLNDWPDVYAALGPDASRKYGITALPGLNGPGSSTLGGANLAISAYSQHQQTALHFIQFMTTPQIQTIMLEQGSFPPALKQLYAEPALTSQFKYLPTLYDAIETARPRPAISNYDQASLVISLKTYEALEGFVTPQEALAYMQSQLTEIIRNDLALH